MPVPKVYGFTIFAVLGICTLLWSCGGSTSSNSSNTTPAVNSQRLSCPSGQKDVMQYFVMNEKDRKSQFVNGQANPIYTEVFPDEDFPTSGYWFWLKSPSANGFDVNAFDQSYVYFRSTELNWTDNTTFKRKHTDLPIAARCVAMNSAGPEIRVSNTQIDWYASCAQYKSSSLGTIVNDLDAPALIDAGGNLGQITTRVLHYHYNCDINFQNCDDEEQFFLGHRYGQWQWKYYHSGALVNHNLLNELQSGTATGSLPCSTSYQ